MASTKNFISEQDLQNINARNEALALARQLIPCFPCSINKVPKCKGGFKSASNDPANVELLWEITPGPLVGVPTGFVSGFDVLDIDPRHGGDIWLEKFKNRLPNTRAHKTRSGGIHFFFQHYPGLSNSAGRIAPGVDVRAEGGCAIWWPAAGLPILSDVENAPWPQWLLARAMPTIQVHLPSKSYEVLRNSGVNNQYISAALRSAVANISNAQEGMRNHTLNSEAYTLSRFIPSGDLDISIFREALTRAALTNGLEEKEISRTLFSVLKARGL